MGRFVYAEWVMWLTSIGLLLAFGGLVFTSWWALFADRARGRRRCPRCWYDLNYSPGMTCPECGFSGRSERDFGRTRRRNFIALLAIIGCTAIGIFVADRANQRGWMTYVPTSVLIWSIPWADDPRGMVMTELDRRMSAQVLDPEQWITILQRCAKGDGGARPGTDAWAAKYGRVIGVWRQTLLGDDDQAFADQVEQILLSIPPHVDLATRRVWPEGVPPTVDVAIREWWPRRMQVRLTAMPDLPEAEPDTHVRHRNDIQRRSYSLYLPAQERGDYEVSVQFAIERRQPGEEDWTPMGEIAVDVPFQVYGEVEAMIEPVDSEELDEIIRQTFSNGIVRYAGGGRMPARVFVSQPATFVELLRDTTVGVRVDVIRNGIICRQLDLWWRAGDENRPRQYAWEVPYWNDEVLSAPDQEDDEWMLRVRGLPELALRVDGPSKYWAGEVLVPCPTRIQPGASPSMGWIKGEAPAATRAAAR